MSVMITGNVKVTPMRQVVVPPPMSAYQLPLPSAAAQVVSPASPSDSTMDIGVLTEDNQFLIFSTNQSGMYICKLLLLQKFFFSSVYFHAD
jgi:hypothetical protein